MSDLRGNPHALPGAAGPQIHVIATNGTTLYAETRGLGPPVLIIAGGAEDAEGWRPVAERIVGHTVVTYDRRGTLRSGREDWPGGGAAQHADDAAALLHELGLREAVVLGSSSGGVIAVELAIRHPASVRRVLAYEPGYLTAVPDGRELQASVRASIGAYLSEHPGDWAGAYDAFAEATAPEPAQERGFVASPEGDAWYAKRERGNAEAFIRDDVPLITAQFIDETAFATCPVEIRFACGAHAHPSFLAISTRLSAIRGDEPDVIEGTGHALYLEPDAAAAYLGLRLGA
jgi:pimeloyl-ACP methyl ester carboxylesterase